MFILGKTPVIAELVPSIMKGGCCVKKCGGCCIVNNTQVKEKMKRKGNNKRSDESRPLNDRANILKKSLAGSEKQPGKE